MTEQLGSRKERGVWGLEGYRTRGTERTRRVKGMKAIEYGAAGSGKDRRLLDEVNVRKERG